MIIYEVRGSQGADSVVAYAKRYPLGRRNSYAPSVVLFILIIPRRWDEWGRRSTADSWHPLILQPHRLKALDIEVNLMTAVYRFHLT